MRGRAVRAYCRFAASTCIEIQFNGKNAIFLVCFCCRLDVDVDVFAIALNRKTKSVFVRIFICASKSFEWSNWQLAPGK